MSGTKAHPRSYSELRRIESHEERFKYLMLGSKVGRVTFGFDRWINQQFYQSSQWRTLRHHIIVRDGGCDLGVKGYEVSTPMYIHHLNPMTPQDIIDSDEKILDPEYLISVTLLTHNAIHYGDPSKLLPPVTERRPGDTKLW